MSDLLLPLCSLSNKQDTPLYFSGHDIIAVNIQFGFMDKPFKLADVLEELQTLSGVWKDGVGEEDSSSLTENLRCFVLKETLVASDAKTLNFIKAWVLQKLAVPLYNFMSHTFAHSPGKMLLIPPELLVEIGCKHTIM